MTRRTSGKTLRACLCCLAITATVRVFAEHEAPMRTGIWVTQKISESAANLAGFEAAIRGNPHLSGVSIHAGWNEIETEAGKPDFTSIDKTIAVLQRLKMKYELTLKPGVNTPTYVFQQGAQSVSTRVTNPHRPNFGEGVTVPVPWDSIYQRNFSRVIAQLGERYAADQLCVGVVLTCANFMGAEMHLPKRPEDRTKWQAMGNYEDKLLKVYSKYTDEWAKAFPHQQISLHLSKVLNLPSTFNERVIEYGLSKYPQRYTIQNCQLTGRREDTGKMSYDLVMKYRDRLHHGFQSLAGFSRGGERMGSIQMAVLNVVHADGEYWELWHDDGLSAETSGAVAKAWDEAKRLGYDEYKKRLMSEGSYRLQEQDNYRRHGKHRGRRALEEPET
jgi:hypothetical protein